MEVYILQKSVSDPRSPVRRVPYRTQAVTLRDLLCEMVQKNAGAETAGPDPLKRLDEWLRGGGERLTFGRERVKFSPEEMREFVCAAFEDKVFLVRNVTRGRQYEALSERLELGEHDELVFVKLKYLRGMI